MTRIIEPPRKHHEKLLTPLTDGERRIIDLFDLYLRPEWEIYVQPYLNGLRPSIVLLHPDVGVAVFEVKDCNLAAMRYYAESDGPNSQILMACDRNGNFFSREAENPINKIQHYKEELFQLYCPRLDNQAGFAAITAGLIFPSSPRSEVERIFGPFLKTNESISRWPRYYPISCIEDIVSGNLKAIFPESCRQTSKMMNRSIADDLRGWLKEPFFSREERVPLILDARQRELATTRTESGYRRIKGAAGSGKSVVIAARASSIAAEGKHVLVVSYNITLLNYLRDLAYRHVASRNVIRRQIDFLNFHYWCKRVCFDSGNNDAYKKLWASSSDGEELHPGHVLAEGLPMLIQRLYQSNNGGANMPLYDAILVDEGQDFRTSWWQTLRLALKVGGEMVLVADKTQNIYGTAAAWTEETMKNAGFKGPWAELRVSYRMPPDLIPLVSRFAEQFMRDEEIDVPKVQNPESQKDFFNYLFPVELRWVQVREVSNGLNACFAELRRMMQRLRPDTAVPDITVLSGAKFGRNLIDIIATKNVHVLHTFDKDQQNSRRQKRAFFQGDARIKATTLHSFKGWESRHLILYVDSVHRPEDRALVYTALTRLLRHEEGSALTVVSCCPELKSYGQMWPEFFEL